MKNEEGKSSNNTGFKLKRKEKSKDDNKGKSAQEKSCAMVNLARAMRVSRREISKNIFKKERKLELTDDLGKTALRRHYRKTKFAQT